MRITTHARTRMQQRGIRGEVVEVLIEYGETIRCKGRGRREIIFLSRKARHLAQDDAPELLRACRSKCPYVVVAENFDVITVGHRTKKINRN